MASTACCAKIRRQWYLSLVVASVVVMSRLYYRSMKTDPDRLPQIGESARALGVRPHRDIPVNSREL